MRSSFQGLSRFDQFQKGLKIAPNMLTRRLNALVESGPLDRQQYNHRPPRFEYVLTERGRDFRPVLWGLLAWGNKQFAPQGASVVIVDAETGELADPVVVDRNSGRPMTGPAYRSAPGPAVCMRIARPKNEVTVPIDRHVALGFCLIGPVYAFR